MAVVEGFKISLREIGLEDWDKDLKRALDRDFSLWEKDVMDDLGRLGDVESSYANTKARVALERVACALHSISREGDAYKASDLGLFCEAASLLKEAISEGATYGHNTFWPLSYVLKAVGFRLKFESVPFP